MVEIFWVLVGLGVISLAAPFVLRVLFPHEITAKELALSVLLSLVLGGFVLYLLVYGGRTNVELRHGHVVSKFKDQVSCEHSYQICTGSGNNRSCTTYYEHSHDYDWVVRTTVGNITINRVDRQGVKEPPRFSKVVIGEPVTREFTYIDYLKGVNNTLLYTRNANKDREFQNLMPRYPRVYDYYRSEPVIFKGIKVDQGTKQAYNAAVRSMLKTLARQKLVNTIVVVVGTERSSFGEYLKNEWRNGRKNDQVVVIGAPEFPKVSWAYAFGWSKVANINKALQYDFANIGELSPANMVETLDNNIRKSFVRRPMEEFKHYIWEAEVSWTKLIGLLLFQVFGNLAICFLIYKYDLV